MNIISVKNKIKKTLAGEWCADKVHIYKIDQYEFCVILAENDRLICREFYSHGTDSAIAYISAYMRSGSVDKRYFYEVYGFNSVTPDKWSGIWALDFNLHDERFHEFTEACREEHPEVGFKEVPNPLNDLLVKTWSP